MSSHFVYINFQILFRDLFPFFFILCLLIQIYVIWNIFSVLQFEYFFKQNQFWYFCLLSTFTHTTQPNCHQIESLPRFTVYVTATINFCLCNNFAHRKIFFVFFLAKNHYVFYFVWFVIVMTITVIIIYSNFPPQKRLNDTFNLFLLPLIPVLSISLTQDFYCVTKTEMVTLSIFCTRWMHSAYFYAWNVRLSWKFHF